MLCWFAFPSARALRSTDSATEIAPALFVGFIATVAGSDFLGSFITGYGFSPSRRGPAVHRWRNPRSPGSRTRSVHTCQVLRPRRIVQALAIARPAVLPSSRSISSAPGMRDFHGSMAGPCAHLSTLRRDPHGSLRTTRCHRGLLDLRCSRLAPLTPCRFCRRTRLPSTGITRLPRYYEPLRHPATPGLSLAGFRLVLRPRDRVSRVAPVFLFLTCHRPCPDGAIRCTHRSLT